MPLQLPNLDDRTYDDLVQEAISLIPTFTSEWTHFNPADPGITLIELFAYLSEILIYRLNRVTHENLDAFLKLLNGPAWQHTESKTLEAEISETVLQLRQCDRAITGTDFENLAMATTAKWAANQQRIARAHCLPRRNLTRDPVAATNAPGHVSVVVVPNRQEQQSANIQPVNTVPQPTLDLLQAVRDYLEPRRLLTTKVHVVGPRYLSIRVQMTLMLKADASETDVQSLATNTLQHFFDPLTGGLEGQGWPFGRHIYVSELYQLLDRLPGVDFVTPTTRSNGKAQQDLPEILVLSGDAAERQIFVDGKLAAIALRPGELVDFQLEPPETPPDLVLKTPPRRMFTATVPGG
jgi:hypothetical protein